MNVGDLMQPGGGHPHWVELAACGGDERFTQKYPPSPQEADELRSVCASCDVFAECRDFHNEWNAVAVFAHGEWRHESGDISNRDTIQVAADDGKSAASPALHEAGGG